MSFDGLRLSPIPLLGAVPAWHARVESGRLPEVCESARAQGGRLAALWGSDERDRGAGFALHLVLANGDGALWLTAELEIGRAHV